MPWNMRTLMAQHSTTLQLHVHQWGGGHANTDHTQSIKWAETVVAVAAAEEKAEYVRCVIHFSSG